MWQPNLFEVPLRMKARHSKGKDVFIPSENGLWIFLSTSPVKKPSVSQFESIHQRKQKKQKEECLISFRT